VRWLNHLTEKGTPFRRPGGPRTSSSDSLFLLTVVQRELGAEGPHLRVLLEDGISRVVLDEGLMLHGRVARRGPLHGFRANEMFPLLSRANAALARA